MFLMKLNPLYESIKHAEMMLCLLFLCMQLLDHCRAHFLLETRREFLDQNYSYTTKFIRRLEVVCIFIKGIYARALFYAKQHTVLEQW